MKISIKQIEKITEYKVKKNFLSIGFDIATRTGVCVIKTNGTSISLDYLFLEFDPKDKKALYRNMVNSFDELINKQDLAVIEEPFVGFSRQGSMELGRFCGFAISDCIKKNVPYNMISAVSARSRFKINMRKYGKGKSKIAVADWLKNNLNIELEDDDISDAIVLALLGICEGMKFKK